MNLDVERGCMAVQKVLTGLEETKSVDAAHAFPESYAVGEYLTGDAWANETYRYISDFPSLSEREAYKVYQPSLDRHAALFGRITSTLYHVVGNREAKYLIRFMNRADVPDLPLLSSHLNMLRTILGSLSDAVDDLTAQRRMRSLQEILRVSVENVGKAEACLSIVHETLANEQLPAVAVLSHCEGGTYFGHEHYLGTLFDEWNSPARRRPSSVGHDGGSGPTRWSDVDLYVKAREVGKPSLIELGSLPSHSSADSLAGYSSFPKSTVRGIKALIQKRMRQGGYPMGEFNDMMLGEGFNDPETYLEHLMAESDAEDAKVLDAEQVAESQARAQEIMIRARKRGIVRGLIFKSKLAKKCRTGYFIDPADTPIRLKNGKAYELKTWLQSEGIGDCELVDLYKVRFIDNGENGPFIGFDDTLVGAPFRPQSGLKESSVLYKEEAQMDEIIDKLGYTYCSEPLPLLLTCALKMIDYELMSHVRFKSSDKANKSPFTSSEEGYFCNGVFMIEASTQFTEECRIVRHFRWKDLDIREESPREYPDWDGWRMDYPITPSRVSQLLDECIKSLRDLGLTSEALLKCLQRPVKSEDSELPASENWAE